MKKSKTKEIQKVLKNPIDILGDAFDKVAFKTKIQGGHKLCMIGRTSREMYEALVITVYGVKYETHSQFCQKELLDEIIKGVAVDPSEFEKTLLDVQSLVKKYIS